MSENYMGNPNLKRTNIVQEWTPEQVDEFIKCARDPVYFIENYIKIVNVDEGLIPFDMYDFQKDMVNTFKSNRFVINKLPRQSGKSTTVVAYMLWMILFFDNQNIAILANKGSLARDLLNKIQMAYEYLPKWMQQGVVVWNKGSIELENGSGIVAASTSSSAIRGGSYNLIFLDEFAFVGNNMADNFFASVYPTISSGKTSQVIVVSTPNGLNHFYRMWEDAVSGKSDYVPIEVYWEDIPGRDQKWKEETIRNTSAEQFAQEFECQFIGSSLTLIEPAKLRTLVWREPEKQIDFLKIYKEPVPGHVYFLVADVSRGVGGDYSAFLVFDVSQVGNYEVVASYRNNKIPAIFYPTVLNNVATKYNEAYVLVETNDMGESVSETLRHDHEYENLLGCTFNGRDGQILSYGYTTKGRSGVKTTKPVKSQGCTMLKAMIESDAVTLNDMALIDELMTFVSNGVSYEAEEGRHDDMVMCLVLFSWATKQEYFVELTDSNLRRRLINEMAEREEEAMLPFGFLQDGQSQESFVDDSGDRWFHEDREVWKL